MVTNHLLTGMVLQTDLRHNLPWKLLLVSVTPYLPSLFPNRWARLDAARLVRDVYSNSAVPPEVREQSKRRGDGGDRDH